MKKLIYLHALLTFPFVLKPQTECNLSNYTSAYIIGANEYPYFSIGSGITVSAVWNCPTLNNFTYSCNSQIFNTKSPAWWLNSATHFVTLTFSQPVSSFSVVVNGTNGTEQFMFSAVTGTITLSNYCINFNAAGSTLIYPIGGTTGTLITVNNNTGSTQYTMTHNGLAAGSRYALLDCFVKTLVLPIELINFEGYYQDGTNKLFWKTASEINNEYFTIERSADCVLWDEITTVLGNCNSTEVIYYSYRDYGFSKGTNYYRLKQTNSDGSFTYYNTIVIDNQFDSSPSPSLITVVNLMGQKVDETYKGILVEIYDDGSVIKKISK